MPQWLSLERGPAYLRICATAGRAVCLQSARESDGHRRFWTVRTEVPGDTRGQQTNAIDPAAQRCIRRARKELV